MNLDVPTMQDLLGAGVHFGHKVSRAHPMMKPYIFGAREGVSILDLAQSEEMLKTACEAMYQYGKDGKRFLVVATKKQARELLEELAKKAGMSYLTQRWVGGLLTNFEEIKKNIRKLNSLKEEQEKGTLSRYTKKEQLLIARKLEKFERDMGGVAHMDDLPEAVFIVDAVADKTAVTEAHQKGLLIVGMSDTNANPVLFDYPVAANDDGIKSIKIVCDALIGAYIKGQEEAGKIAQKQVEKTEKEAKQAEEIKLNESVLEEAAVLEEQVEKEIVAESKVE